MDFLFLNNSKFIEFKSLKLSLEIHFPIKADPSKDFDFSHGNPSLLS